MDLSLCVWLVQTLVEIDGIVHASHQPKLQGVRQTQVHLGIWCSFSELTEWSTSCKKSTYMLSIGGTPTRMNINSKVYS